MEQINMWVNLNEYNLRIDNNNFLWGQKYRIEIYDNYSIKNKTDLNKLK